MCACGVQPSNPRLHARGVHGRILILCIRWLACELTSCADGHGTEPPRHAQGYLPLLYVRDPHLHGHRRKHRLNLKSSKA